MLIFDSEISGYIKLFESNIMIFLELGLGEALLFLKNLIIIIFAIPTPDRNVSRF